MMLDRSNNAGGSRIASVFVGGPFYHLVDREIGVMSTTDRDRIERVIGWVWLPEREPR